MKVTKKPMAQKSIKPPIIGPEEIIQTIKAMSQIIKNNPAIIST